MSALADGKPLREELGVAVPTALIAPPTLATSSTKKIGSTCIVHPFFDFWLLGGASILIWLIMVVSESFRADSPVVQQRFMQIGSAFGLLTLICNHPHFMISYKFGYGRGLGFVVRNWFSLIAVPVLLVAAYGSAYYFFDVDINAFAWVGQWNSLVESAGIGFRLGKVGNLGTEILGLSVWAMYVTVGWHYSKQIFGCMMVYAKFDGYPLTAFQRGFIKLSVFSIAFFQFTYFTTQVVGDTGEFRFFGMPLTALSLPSWLYQMSVWTTVAAVVAVILFVFARNFKAHALKPSPNFLVPWVAFHVWWFPMVKQPEFLFLMVPFFHSLQYLPFAYKLANPRTSTRPKWAYAQLSMKLFGLLAIGFLAFELVPGALDKSLQTETNQLPWFFTIAFAIAINIHHFFIDSVVWKFKQPQIQDGLFDPEH